MGSQVPHHGEEIVGTEKQQTATSFSWGIMVWDDNKFDFLFSINMKIYIKILDQKKTLQTKVFGDNSASQQPTVKV